MPGSLQGVRGRRCCDVCVGMALRSYLYVEDVAAAFDLILHKGIVGQTYNIGSRRERSVLSVATDITKLFGLPTSRITHVRDRAFNDRRYFVCDRKLAALGVSSAVLGSSTQTMHMRYGVVADAHRWCSLCARHFICSVCYKLVFGSVPSIGVLLRTAGWTETTDWAEGLRKTSQWYQEHGFSEWWDNKAVTASLEAHPVYFQTQHIENGSAFKEVGQRDVKALAC